MVMWPRTLTQSLPTSLGRPWPPLGCPWDFPLPAHITSVGYGTGSVLKTFDGHLLHAYAISPDFEEDILHQIQMDMERQRYPSIPNALTKIPVERGMPPASDPWVMKNIVEGAVRSCSIYMNEITQREFVEALRKVLLEVVSRLKTKPVRIALTTKTYDATFIAEFLDNKHGVQKTLKMIWKSLPKDHHGRLPREYFGVALDILAPAVGLPAWRTVEKMEKIVGDILMKLRVEEGGEGALKRKEFRKIMVEILCSIMQHFGRDPITLNSYTVITLKPRKIQTLMSLHREIEASYMCFMEDIEDNPHGLRAIN